MKNNDYAGVKLSDSSYNDIYHNSFIGNRHHALDNANNIWDNGYPSGGNYWDDYDGLDGNGDGIGDRPYDIADGINKDRYPLMQPYGESDTTPPSVRILYPDTGLYIRNRNRFPRLFQFGTFIFGEITIEVEAADWQSGISRVEFYLDNNPTPQATDDTEPFSWTWGRGQLLKHRHSLIVVAYDNQDNHNIDSMTLWKFF